MINKITNISKLPDELPLKVDDLILQTRSNCDKYDKRTVIVRTAGRYKKIRGKRLLPYFRKNIQNINRIQEYGKRSCIITKSDLTVGASNCIRIITKRSRKFKS